MGRKILRMSDVILAQLFGHSPGWRIKTNPLPADARVVRAWMGTSYGCRAVFLEMESDSWPEVPPAEMTPFVDPEPILETIEPPGVEPISVGTLNLADVRMMNTWNDDVTGDRPEPASSAGELPRGWVDKGVASGSRISPGIWYQCDWWNLAVATNADGSETWSLSPRDAGHPALAIGEDCHRFATKDQAFAWAEANDRPAPAMPSPPPQGMVDTGVASGGWNSAGRWYRWDLSPEVPSPPPIKFREFL